MLTFFELYSVEEHLHVCQGIDRNADLPYLSHRQRMVGIHAHLSREIKGDR